MLRLKNIFALSLFASLALVSKAGAGLYGFNPVNKLSVEEEVLDLEVPPLYIPNYRQQMRDNLLMLIDYAKAERPGFMFMAHLGEELLNKSLWELHLEGYNQARRKGINADDPAFLLYMQGKKTKTHPAEGTPAFRYLHSLNGIVLNNLYCGKNTPAPLTLSEKLPIFTVEQCPDDESFDHAIIRSISDRRPLYGFTNVDYAFNDLSHQPLINESARNIYRPAEANNFLILNDDTGFKSKFELVEAVNGSNYDLVIINPLFHNREAYSAEEIRHMQFKKNGTRRLLFAEMNLSEANPAKYYWNPQWQIDSPSWLVRPSFATPGAVITRYWHPEWRRIISQHFKDIVAADYDGVLFTGIENHKFFEKQTPLE